MSSAFRHEAFLYADDEAFLDGLTTFAGDAVAAGEPVAVTPTSVADGLNAPFAGELGLAVCRALVDTIVLVDEAEIAAGFRFLYERAKLACEPAGAAATAAVLAGKIAFEPGETVVVIVSGGNVAPETAAALLTGAPPR